ncbi:MAG: methyltransferase domain-containing protein [Oligoflexales bacterium]|nr:methyltransferase domain-containing protein [Oligoflexales bacterium]
MASLYTEKKVEDTKSVDYANRLESMQKKSWKENLRFLDPYRMYLRYVCRGQTLDIGCGIERVLGFLDNVVGIDHNIDSVKMCKRLGYKAFTSEEFIKSSFAKKDQFETILLSHVAEHMTTSQCQELIDSYLPFLKSKGRLVLITPQENGYKSDSSHVEFMDFAKLALIGKQLGFQQLSRYSFPFPRIFGRFYIYNEFVYIGVKK